MIQSINLDGPLIECVLNVSEGRNIPLLDSISNATNEIDGVSEVHRDIGFDVNRTVYTMIGIPDAVMAAIGSIFEIADQKMDMRMHHGEHPRVGALDVIPLIPIQNISYKECQLLLRKWGARWSIKFQIPICYYGEMAGQSDQRTLAQIRSKTLKLQSTKKINSPLVVDHGGEFKNAILGISCCTVRDYMVAFNINLSTQDLAVSKQLAATLRSSRKDLPQLKNVRFLAWYMEQYQCAQISTNIYDINAITVQELYQYVQEIAETEFGIQVNGCELIGMTPKRGICRNAIDIEKVIKTIGMSSESFFNTKERILEEALGLDNL